MEFDRLFFREKGRCLPLQGSPTRVAPAARAWNPAGLSFRLSPEQRFLPDNVRDSCEWNLHDCGFLVT